MEEDMEMEEEMIQVYEVHEIDFDYEFDAARYFDFSRPESEAEARLSELWFDSAPSCPPSPFLAKLFPMEDTYSQNVDVSPKSKYGDTLSLIDGDSDIDQRTEYCDQDEEDRGGRRQVSLLHNLNGCNLPDSQSQAGLSKGLSFYNHLANDMKKPKSKSLAKPYMPRSSTLMKPTASQLAKQTHRRQACDYRKLFQKSESSSNVQCGIESQASKRQKLDGGHLRRIVDTKLPINLIRKIPNKDGALQGTQTKLRITIPQEPDLETTHRAERIRPQSKKGVDPPSTTGRFKARPMMGKIPEAPVHPPKRTTQVLQDSQAFCFKTNERTKAHTFSATAVPLCQSEKGSSKVSAASIVETGNNDMKRSDAVAAPKLAERQLGHSFKARPLDRKILTSRGDLGVFRNSKRDITVPKAFEFQTSKRNQLNPPIDLFSKLSLASELQPKSSAQLQLPQPQKTCLPKKGSKENRWDSCQQDQNMKLQIRETHSKQSVGVTGIGSGNGLSRTFGIWRK